MMKKKENRLLRRARSFRANKALKPAPPRFREYGWAYREAARALFEATSSKLDSFAAFPLVFLYRQAIELLLKFILIELGWYWGIQRQQVVARKHNLVDQLADVEHMAKSIGAKVSREVKGYVGQFNGIDPKSDAFRFPEHRCGKPTLTEKEESFDVEQFVSRAEQVLDELGELADELDDTVFQAILQEEAPQ